MKKLLKPFILIILTVISFAACEVKKNKKTLETAALDNTSWLLVRFSDQELFGHEIRLNFEDGKLNGKAVCNNYFSTYSINGNEISVLPIGATRMLCPENSKLETDYFNFFSKTSNYELRENILILKNEIGTLEFKK
ncbi:MAG: META domain-containing protein [Moorea sp. SIOASIH]|uniref:META domain-containing protein n=1 Tax=Moorena sp. SIOASIH TaxID=2607817 RepID=UPI0013BC2590|nr:META domain-containing protein [Moorena sp. SIOASIH]NEO42633.1 META domain-containing protein [Moorena sp. SIOASIH]